MIQITVQLYGSARSLYKEDKVNLQMDNGVSVNDIRLQLIKKFQEYNSTSNGLISIVESSVLATESEILANETKFFNDIDLVIMPPVSGG